MSQSTLVAEDIAAVVQGVPGVSGLFQPRTALAALATTVTGAGSRVRVQQRDDESRIDIAIGVAASASARETVRAVHERVSEYAAHVGAPAPRIVVTVVHIDDSAPTLEAAASHPA